MMLWAWTLVLSVLASAESAKTPVDKGISQFWTDDYKVFDQIYGKTSDKEIYGATLPPTISYGIDVAQLKPFEATDKKERYIDNDGQNTNLDDEQIDPYSFGNRYPYNNLLAKEAIKALSGKKPTKPPLKFISTNNFKPISQASDPETYNYLKHLEKLQKQKVLVPESVVGGFKPYITYTGTNPEDTEGYKSIQDILEAHEANEGNKGKDDDDEQVDYITYPPKTRNRAKKPRAPVKNVPNSRCPSGRCRKRTPTSYRVYRSPYVRRIKHKIIY